MAEGRREKGEKKQRSLLSGSLVVLGLFQRNQEGLPLSRVLSGDGSVVRDGVLVWLLLLLLSPSPQAPPSSSTALLPLAWP